MKNDTLVILAGIPIATIIILSGMNIEVSSGQEGIIGIIMIVFMVWSLIRLWGISDTIPAKNVNNRSLTLATLVPIIILVGTGMFYIPISSDVSTFLGGWVIIAGVWALVRLAQLPNKVKEEAV
jgi:hypothetical protein